MDHHKRRLTPFSPRPEVITFDAANTLIYLPQPVGQHYMEVGRQHGLMAGAEAWQHAFLSAWKSLPRPEVTEGPSPDDHRGWWRQLVRTAAAEALGNSAMPADEHFEEFFLDLYDHFEKPGVWELTEPNLPMLLADLREAGFRLGVLSNFDQRLRRILADLGVSVFFETMIISSEVGVEKPDRRIYEAARKALGMPAPEKCLHVGDEQRSDWQGARQAGWQVCEVARERGALTDLRALL